jgi:hypothetical protein
MRNRLANIEKSNGILTISIVAFLTTLSRPTIRKFCDNGTLKHFKMPASNERRILAPDLLEFLKENKMPVTDQILSLTAAYERYKARVREL